MMRDIYASDISPVYLRGVYIKKLTYSQVKSVFRCGVAGISAGIGAPGQNFNTRAHNQPKKNLNTTHEPIPRSLRRTVEGYRPLGESSGCHGIFPAEAGEQEGGAGDFADFECFFEVVRCSEIN